MTHEQAINLSNTDRFSWRRVAMVARYFAPRLRWQMILYPVLSAIIFCFSYIAIAANQFTLGTTIAGITSYFFCFAPIVFGTRRDSAYFATLPALGSEKFAFVIIYCFFVIPFLIYMPMLILDVIFPSADSNSLSVTVRMLKEAGIESVSMVQIALSSCVSTCAQTALCLWVVMASSVHRVLKGILIPLAINFVFGVITGIIMSINLLSGISTRSADSTTIVLERINVFFTQAYPIMTIVFFAYLAVCITYVWRTICHKQA